VQLQASLTLSQQAPVDEQVPGHLTGLGQDGRKTSRLEPPAERRGPGGALTTRQSL